MDFPWEKREARPFWLHPCWGQFLIPTHTSPSPLGDTRLLELGCRVQTPPRTQHKSKPPGTPVALINPPPYLPKHKAVQRDPHGPDIQSLQSEESTVTSATVWARNITPKPLQFLLKTFPEKIFLVSESVSGAMKAGVPTVLVKRASAPLNSLLTPKSAILMCPSSPTRRLEGLMSRWIIF